MPTQPISTAMSIYYFPLNERIRLILRLQQIFKHIESAQQYPDKNNLKLALEGLVLFIGLSARYDIRSELMKEIERIHLCIHDRCNILQDAHKQLHTMPLRHMMLIRQDEFLNILKQKISLSALSFDLDIPRLKNWLDSTQQFYQTDLATWSRLLSPIITACYAILNCYNDHKKMLQLSSKAGFCQFMLHKNTSLIHIDLAQYPNLYPEFSGNHQRMIMRIYQQTTSINRVSQINEDHIFMLTTSLI